MSHFACTCRFTKKDDCGCGEKQIAFASDWQTIPVSFPDVRDECQKKIDGIKK